MILQCLLDIRVMGLCGRSRASHSQTRRGKGGTVMEARGKERNVAVQREAPEFLAGSDLDLSSSNC